MKNEINWGWPEICVVMLWKLAPKGIEVRVADLIALPMDRVGMIKRRPEYVQLRFIPIGEAQKKVDHPDEAGEKALVEELHGRWQKAVWVVLWKLRKQGVRLTLSDKDAVPADKQLLMHAPEKSDAILYRFVPHAEAERIAKWERENEGRIILERSRL
jgi:hypothetical protein